MVKFFSFFLPLWYPFSVHQLQANEIYKNRFFNHDYVMYKDINDSIVIHSNICPHQGSQFSNGGFLNKDKNIVCPYHGFTYENGSFIGICHQEKLKKKQKQTLPTFHVQEMDDLIFINENENSRYDIFQPPEEYDPDFRSVSGWSILSNNYLTVTENLLDMLHISFVHSFGSKSNVPDNIQFEKISKIHGKTSFFYNPSRKSLGSILSEKDYTVKVENEFILPTNTITRVFIGDSIKTVFTRSIPIEENKTLLYWKLYRNFWNDNIFLNYFGDFFIRHLMKKVIQEDIQILKGIRVDDRDGPVKTKYDQTILQFRKFTKEFIRDLKIEDI